MEPNRNIRGWSSIETRMRANGMDEAEINQAGNSFYEGMGVLLKLYLSSREKYKK